MKLSVIEDSLSDQSKVYSVVLNENGLSIQIDCLSQIRANNLMRSIRDAIWVATNVEPETVTTA